VFAFVPDEETNRFFVLPQNKVNQGIQEEFDRARARSIAKGGNGEKAERFPCVPWDFLLPWENKWKDVLPS
jgi:hypothetical protein